MIPVSVIGGFLGAGKTTLVNHLLRVATRRYAVLVNDFGAVSVDAALITGSDGAVLSLANGCVCCAIGPDLGDTLDRLARRDPPPEYILIEASGVSDPWRIAQLVKLEPAVALDAVLVLVDATAFPDQLADRYLTDTLERQLARADLVIISKCDVAGAPATLTAEVAVRRLRPEARTARVSGGAMPEWLLAGPTLDARGRGSRIAAELPAHPFRTWTWRDPPCFDTAALGAALDALPPAVLRLKGFCRIGPAGARHIVQLAGRRWSLVPGGSGPDVLVVIGTDAMPSPADLDALFRAAALQRVAVQ